MVPALVLALAAPSGVNTLQIFNSPAFEAFARRSDRLCPAQHLRRLTPGDLAWEQERFEEALSPIDDALLSTADNANTRCAGRDGLSCPASAKMEALGRQGLIPRFAAFACGHPPP